MTNQSHEQYLGICLSEGITDSIRCNANKYKTLSGVAWSRQLRHREVDILPYEFIFYYHEYYYEFSLNMVESATHCIYIYIRLK